MSNDIVVTMTSDDRDLLQSFMKQNAALDRVTRKYDELQRKSKEAGDAAKKAGNDSADAILGGAAAADKLIGGLAGVGGAVAGIALIAEQLRTEYDRLIERQSKAATSQIDLAAAQRDALINLGNDPTLSPKQLEAGIKQMSARTGVGEAVLYQGASALFSAKGDLSAADAMETLEATSMLIPDQPQNVPTLAASVMDLQGETGSTAKEVLGFIMNLGQASRVTKLNALAENVVPSVIGATKFGGTLQDTAAANAAIGAGMVDTTGATSGSTTIALAKQLAERFPELPDMDSRMKAIQNDPALFKKFFEGGTFGGRKFEKATFETKSLPTVMSLLNSDKDDKVSRAYKNAIDLIDAPQNSGGKYDQVLDAINSLPVQQNAAIDRTLKAGASRLQTGNITDGQGGISREGLEQILDSIQVTSLGKKAIQSAFELSSGGGTAAPVDALAGRLDIEGNRLSRPTVVAGGGFGAPASAAQMFQQRSPEELEQSRVLLQIADSLRQILDESKKNKVVKVEEVRPKAVRAPGPRSIEGAGRPQR